MALQQHKSEPLLRKELRVIMTEGRIQQCMTNHCLKRYSFYGLEMARSFSIPADGRVDFVCRE